MTTFHFLVQLFSQSSVQFISIFGLLIAGGAALTFLSRLTSNTFRQFVLPKFGIYFFGWIGVPVHEFCHAFFCKLFFHDVKTVKWFDPEAKDGANGSVTHEYHPWNPIHRIGQFFIGVGPVLLGPVILTALFYFLVPTAHGIFHQDMFSSTATFRSVMQIAVLVAQAIVCKATLSSFKFYIFLYLTLCISSQMELSTADMKQVLIGAVPLFLVLLLINGINSLAHTNWHTNVLHASFWVTAFASVIFSFAALLAFMNLVLCFFVMTLINRCAGKNGINPFQM